MKAIYGHWLAGAIVRERWPQVGRLFAVYDLGNPAIIAVADDGAVVVAHRK
jgi:hypothetical protein